MKRHDGQGQDAGLTEILRRLVCAEQADAADVQIGPTLCLAAGAANAGGLLVVGQYTSHMSGIISALADNLVVGRGSLIVAGLGSVLSFAGRNDALAGR